jgi:hypothetical protein
MNPSEWKSRTAGEFSGMGADQDVSGGKTWKINTQLRLNDPRLVVLNVGYNTVGADGALLLAQGLRYNTTLISCVAAGIDAGDGGAAAFGAALTTNATLVSLDLGLNDIGEEGAHRLGRGLAQNATLTHLSLAGNVLQDRGARNLAPHLAGHAALTALDLRANDARPAAAVALAEALAGRNAPLTSLDLRANCLGSRGALALVACVARNGALRRVDLSDNGIEGGALLTPLAEALENQPFGGVEEFVLRGNRGLPDVSDPDPAAYAELKRRCEEAESAAAAAGGGGAEAEAAAEHANAAVRCWRAIQCTRNALRVSRERLAHVLASTRLTPRRERSCSAAHFLTSPVGMDAYEAQALPAAAGGSEARIKYFRAIGTSEGWFAGVVASLQVFEAREQIKLVDWQRWRRIPQAAELLGPQREPYHRRGLGEDDTWALAHAAAHAPPPTTPPPAGALVVAEAGGDAEGESKKAASADGKDEEKKADDGNGKYAAEQRARERGEDEK